MGSSREMWSSSNRDGRRGGVNGEGGSATLGSSGSAGAWRKKSKFLAPECNCGTYAILFMSSTLGNPNRLFYVCPYFKTPAPHCKYFAWLDDYVASCEEEVTKHAIHGRGKQIDTQQQTDSAQFERIVRKLENRVIELEMQLRDDKHVKSGSGFSSVSLMVVAFVFGIAFGNLIKALG
ncbi:hypothetical protein PIB30_073260 [Stylosanthes scabra]|uniref:GRF-type domain-containing protein n=1 Tax=Stylosanthes scabra TaxID=79078 RepID=A0ABU6RP84_9FABA|nr:hypothetical protein [Stylosanthes scabra]